MDKMTIKNCTISLLVCVAFLMIGSLYTTSVAQAADPNSGDHLGEVVVYKSLSLGEKQTSSENVLQPNMVKTPSKDAEPTQSKSVEQTQPKPVDPKPVQVVSATQKVTKKKPQISEEQYTQIINLAGKQRMLSQKMTKEALMLLAGIHPDENAKKLKETMALFDKTLKGLKDGDDSLNLAPCHSSEIIKQLQEVKKSYEPLRSAFLKVLGGISLSVPELEKVEKDSLIVLENSNKAVQMFTKEAQGELGTTTNKVLNDAGRQRMLSQKISKEILLVYLDIDHDENQAALAKTSNLFSMTLKELQTANKNSDIENQLGVVEEMWSYFSPAIDSIALMGKGGMTSIEMTIVDAWNLPLLKESNNVVELYERAGL